MGDNKLDIKTGEGSEFKSTVTITDSASGGDRHIGGVVDSDANGMAGTRRKGLCKAAFVIDSAIS